jgi:hypothetical protein
MAEEYGDVRELRYDGDTESLNLSFWPGSVPLQQRWRNNGLSADFLGDYVTTFFPLDDNDPATRARQNEIRGAVAFIANELLENAMKFHDGSLPEPITVHLNLQRERMLLQQSNAVNNKEAERFRGFVRKLRESDPGDLYIQQLEDNALSEGSAGLGYLTMINDYQAELAWRFDALAETGFRVTTQVTIRI